MKIFYEIPDTESERESRLMGLLFENFKLKMMWKLRKIEHLILKENGSIYIDQIPGNDNLKIEDGLNLRFEGFSPELELMIKGLVSGKITVK